MKSKYIHFKNPVVSALCRYCHKTVVARTSRTVLDDDGSLAITAWICGECDSVNQEIDILPKNGQVMLRPNGYVAAP